MPLSLYVLRHAKAEESSRSGQDHDRELKGRGVRAAREAGRFLARLDEAPGLVLSSSAARARETAELAAEAAGWEAPLELRDALYEATADELLEELRTAPPDVQRLLLVGHQPSLSLLIAELTGSEPEFPTAALARVGLEPERWSELGPRCGRLVWLVTPAVIEALRRRKPD